MPANPREKVDHKDWLALTYTEAEWTAYIDRERARTEVPAWIWLGLGGIWIVLATCLFLSPAVSDNANDFRNGFRLLVYYLIAGLLPGGVVILAGRYYIQEARKIYHLRKQDLSRTIRIAAREMREPGRVIRFVEFSRQPVAVCVSEGAPARLQIVLRSYSYGGRGGPSTADTKLNIPIPAGHEAEAEIFVRRFRTEVIGAYCNQATGSVPQALLPLITKNGDRPPAPGTLPRRLRRNPAPPQAGDQGAPSMTNEIGHPTQRLPDVPSSSAVPPSAAPGNRRVRRTPTPLSDQNDHPTQRLP
jgi:hypothetical protein